MLDSPAYEALRLIEQRRADERNLRAQTLEAAIELVRLNGASIKGSSGLIEDAERVLSFLQVPEPAGAEALVSDLVKAVCGSAE
jgi:hypothetical protein